MRATLISIKAIKFVSLYFWSFDLMCYRSRNHAMAMKLVSNNSYPFFFSFVIRFGFQHISTMKSFIIIFYFDIKDNHENT